MKNIAIFMFIVLGGSAAAAENDIRLKEGTGRLQTVVNCSLCHSLDYIQMNSAFLGRKGWEATVNKMIKSFGAPITDKDVPIIIDYLTKNY